MSQIEFLPDFSLKNVCEADSVSQMRKTKACTVQVLFPLLLRGEVLNKNSKMMKGMDEGIHV